MTSWVASKQKKRSTAVKLFKNNGYRRESKIERKRSRMEENKQPSKQKRTKLDLERYYPKVLFKQSSKIK